MSVFPWRCSWENRRRMLVGNPWPLCRFLFSHILINKERKELVHSLERALPLVADLLNQAHDIPGVSRIPAVNANDVTVHVRLLHVVTPTVQSCVLFSCGRPGQAVRS